MVNMAPGRSLTSSLPVATTDPAPAPPPITAPIMAPFTPPAIAPIAPPIPAPMPPRLTVSFVWLSLFAVPSVSTFTSLPFDP